MLSCIWPGGSAAIGVQLLCTACQVSLMHAACIQGASSSSWRLWPFSGWRDAAPAKSSLPNAKSPPSSSSPAPPSIQKSASDIANYDSKQSSAGTSPRASMLKSEEAAQLSRASAPPMLRGHSFTSTLGLSGPNSLALTSPPARKR